MKAKFLPVLVLVLSIILPQINSVPKAKSTAPASSSGYTISGQVTAVYVDIHAEDTKKLQNAWKVWGQDIPLVVIQSPYRSIIGPLLEFLEQTDREYNDGQLATVLLPEFILKHWWQNLLHNQTANLLRMAILYSRRKHGHARAIIDMPFYIDE